MDQDIITLKFNVSIEVAFKSYRNYELNEKAKEQITIWIDETLAEEDQVPLFVASNAGEESVSKIIKVNCE